MTDYRPDFQYQHRTTEIVRPLEALPLDAASRHAVGNVSARFEDRDRLLEDFLGFYRDLDLTEWSITQGAGTTTIDTSASLIRARRLGTRAQILAAFELSAVAGPVAGQEILVNFPVAWRWRDTSAIVDLSLGDFAVFDDSGPIHYFGWARPNSTSALGSRTDGRANGIGNTPNFALAAGDVVRLQLDYELAVA